MKIAAVGDDRSRKAMASKILRPGIVWAWVNGVGELERHPDAALYIDLDFAPDKVRIGQLSRLLPKPVLIHSVTHTLAEIGQPFIRINGWSGMLERTPSELAVRGKEEEAGVEEVFGGLDWAYRIVPDIPGMISGRILAAIINEAYHTLQDRVSTREEIDAAMRLGTHYPLGPFEWGHRIGLGAIYELLETLSRTEPRYRVAEALAGEVLGIKI